MPDRGFTAAIWCCPAVAARPSPTSGRCPETPGGRCWSSRFTPKRAWRAMRPGRTCGVRLRTRRPPALDSQTRRWRRRCSGRIDAHGAEAAAQVLSAAKPDPGWPGPGRGRAAQTAILPCRRRPPRHRANRVRARRAGATCPQRAAAPSTARTAKTCRSVTPPRTAEQPCAG